ncbi:MAG: 7-cyano-7-deazaguanine synthase QueC [Thermodesulfobacteriota bacterium]|nr:7-cyano-7-deazaguanine synthase QueC [Thermodesulfobacteriota bacterium]
MTQPPKKAVVLSSGGIDSTTAMAIAQDRGFSVYSLSFAYGQRHQVELDAAASVAVHIGAKDHLIIQAGLDAIGGSALTDDIPVPDAAAHNENDIPVTYVPARNTIFLSYALAWAETLGAFDIFIGVNSVDYSGYPDCRPEYIAAYEKMANLATKAGVSAQTRLTIHTPLIHMTKADIIKTGISLGVDYGMTLSCYNPSPDGLACGKCESCAIRRQGFIDAGVADPTRYAEA